MKRAITQIFTLLLLVTLAVPAFAGKVLAEIEYFYSDDGTLIGKAFNGNRVNFEYDLRGQLLAVKDAQGKDLERYTYDPAGNRLSKTINGVTTTYTYDKANQLVTSTVNGVTTHYKYDAAGRMVQAGDKSYIYNGQNKVSEVRQNDKTIAKFEYNIDGQIAKAIYGDKVEEFMWDGLALIWRSGVTYINEPYVTGGNPVMAGDDVLFNDMLGSTLAVNDKAVEMTSFGETGDKNAFFTGKPMIDELGYSFLFRDYNPNQGKWTTSDPLGYPDGWNNLAYVNNGCAYSYDMLGAWLGIDDCVAMLTGAVIGASIQTVSNIIQGKDWHEGVAQATVVGMFSAEAGLHGGPVAGAAVGAATNAALTAMNQAVDSYCTGSEIKTDEILTDAALDFTSSVVTAGVLPPGTVSGQGSITAVSQQMMTKLKNGTIKNLKNSTQIKTLIGNIIRDCPDAVADSIYRKLLDLSKRINE